MRQMILALAVAAVGGFAFASCGSSSNNNADTGKTWRWRRRPDIAIAKTNCTGVARASTPADQRAGDINTCDTLCAKNAKAGSATKWTTRSSAARTTAPATKDMMTGKCVSVPEAGHDQPERPHMLCDPGIDIRAVQRRRTTCRHRACPASIRRATSGSTTSASIRRTRARRPACARMPTGADCTGAKAGCMTQFNACLNDT